MSHHSQGTVDQLDLAAVLDQHERPGPKFTFVVPTDVTGQGDTVSALMLKNQVKDARQRLVEDGMREAEADEFLAPVTELVDDSSYWRLQSRSLVVFLSQGFFRAVRVPVELTEHLTVGAHFHLLPLAAVIASDRKVYVLTLAKNSVRLFDSSRNVITEMALEGIPASFDEVVDELPERTVDVRSGAAGAGGTPSFHGPDGDLDRELLEKFIREVGKEVGVRLGTARSQLLVLAAVEEYLPIFRAACPYPAIFDGVVAGNHERTLPDDLRSAAWHLVNDRENAHEATETDHAMSLAHAGKGSFDLTEIVEAAQTGRVDTLFLPRDPEHVTSDDRRDLANLALLGTLGASGVVRTLGAAEHEALATFRW